jgi:hypothetical protein
LLTRQKIWVLEKKPSTVGAEQASVEMPMSIFRNCAAAAAAAGQRRVEPATPKQEKMKAGKNEGFGLSAPGLGFRAVL